MRRTILSCSVLAALALSAGPALAEPFSGEITKIDRGSRSIEVREGDSQRKLRFFLARGGEVRRDGQPASFATLKRGERVEIDFSTNGPTNTARSVAVVASGAGEAVATRE